MPRVMAYLGPVPRPLTIHRLTVIYGGGLKLHTPETKGAHPPIRLDYRVTDGEALPTPKGGRQSVASNGDST